MSQFVQEGQISGAVTLVAGPDRILHLSAVGQADVENERPLQTDSVFAIASMSKPITRQAFHQGVDDVFVSNDAVKGRQSDLRLMLTCRKYQFRP